MKKLMSVLLGMSIALGTVSLFAQDTSTDTKMEKKTKKTKKAKKTEKSSAETKQ